MKGNRIIEAIIISVCLGAVAVSGTAIVDVATLKERSVNQMDILKEMRDDIRDISRILKGVGND